jgi:hypothetical protein
MLTAAHKTQRMALALTFLERYNKDVHEFLNHIVTGDETLVSFGNVETKEQSKQWQTSARKLMAAVFRDRKGVLMVEFMQQGSTMSEVYCKTLNKLVGPFRTKGAEC